MDLTYDPEQDPEERRRVRRNYRDLAKEAESWSTSWIKGGPMLIGSQMRIQPSTPRLRWLDSCAGPMISSGEVRKTAQQPPRQYR